MTSSSITDHCLIKATKTFSYKKIKRIMVTVRQKRKLGTKKHKKSTQDSKNSCDDQTKKTIKKIKLEKRVTRTASSRIQKSCRRINAC